jgi:hypothetical protein
MGAIFIIAGSIAIVLAFIGKEFGISDPDAMSSFDRKSSKRSGGLVFAIAGIMLIAFGIKFLLFQTEVKLISDQAGCRVPHSCNLIA